MSATAGGLPRRVGLTLATVQFFFALSWVAYVIYLPALAATMGIPARWVVGLLIVDQFVFLLADYACGVWSDRMARLHGRFGPAVLAGTLVSALAFLLLPWVAPTGSAPLFVALMLLWSLSSSVLRAPPLNLIGRYVPRPAQPAMVALSMLGLGLASALAPYLGLLLKGADPRWPFLLASLALVASTAGIVAAERALQALPAPPAAGSADRPGWRVPAGLALGVALLVTLAFQQHVFLNSAPLYLRLATPAELPWLMPAFWVGFNLGLWPASLAARHWGAPVALSVAAAGAALGASAAQAGLGLGPLVIVQGLTGLAWAVLLTSAFAAALAIGRGGREGRCAGALSSVLALAALSRLLLQATGQAPAVAGTTLHGLQVIAPAALWALAAGAGLMAMRPRRSG